jgi:hypothetical protein
MALLTPLAEKPFAERNKASGGSQNQPQAPRNTRADQRGQAPQGQAAHLQQQMHSMQQMQPQGFRDQRDSYSQAVVSAEHDDATIFWRISLSLATAEHAKSDAKCTQHLQFWTILSTHGPTIYV